jgi:hypothetical protein
MSRLNSVAFKMFEAEADQKILLELRSHFRFSAVRDCFEAFFLLLLAVSVLDLLQCGFPQCIRFSDSVFAQL